MSISCEQQRKKSLARDEAERHHQYAAVDGMKSHDVSMNHHNERFNPYSDMVEDERKEHGENINIKKFNEAGYKL